MVYNPYANYQPMYPQYPQQVQAPIQTIQQIQPKEPAVRCFFVDKEQMQNIEIEPNTVYIGINKQKNEIYTRAWNNNGLIENKTYSVAEEQKETSELQKISDRLAKIEEKIDEKLYSKTGRAENEQPFNAKPEYGAIQSDDERKEPRRTKTGNS